MSKDKDALHDWNMMHHERVQSIVERASQKVADEREVDADDLYQDAWLFVTDLRTDLPGFFYEEKFGHLYTALYRDLLDSTKTAANNQWRLQSYDVRHEEDDDGESAAPVAIAHRPDGSQYDRELVTSLLPAVWDWQFCWGMQVENAPDGDMPRSSPNKATGNTLAAHLVDIRDGWEKAPLSLRERQSAFLVAGLDMTTTAAGDVLGVTHQAISQNVERAVGKIVATLNGDAALLDSLEEDAA
jgi:hypothetical protein